MIWNNLLVICKTQGGKHEWEEELNKAWFICVKGGIYVLMWPIKVGFEESSAKVTAKGACIKGYRKYMEKKRNKK